MTKIRFNRPTTFVTTIALAGLFFANGAAAHGGAEGKGPRHGKNGGHYFQKVDANKDGKIQKAEAQKMAQERFSRVDTNKDGVITRAEAQKMAESRTRNKRQDKAGKGDAHIDKLFERADKNKNGRVEKSESRLPAEKFDRLDTNKDGALTRAEMKAAMSRLRAEHGKKIFEKMDANDDGKVTLAEAQSKADERFAKMDLNKDGAVTREEARASMPRLHKAGRRGPHKGQKRGSGGS